MQISTISTIKIPHIPSASGIEFIDPWYFVIGDDSNYLYILNKDFEIIQTVKIFDAGEFETLKKIPKPFKRDLEGLTKLKLKNTLFLFALGSGSGPLREKGYLIATTPPFEITELDLGPFYAALSNLLSLGNNRLNMEGLAADENNIHFLHRGNISGNNSLVSVNTAQLFEYLKNPSSLVPPANVRTFKLPQISGILAGFSGAVTIENTTEILFTASVENTKNEIDDGENLQSYVGIIDLNNEQNRVKDIVAITTKPGHMELGKLESITISGIHDFDLDAVAVTDNDGSDSELIKMRIKL